VAVAVEVGEVYGGTEAVAFGPSSLGISTSGSPKLGAVLLP
jgi:hypothetical protein